MGHVLRGLGSMLLSNLGGGISRGRFVLGCITPSSFCMNLYTRMNTTSLSLYEEAVYALNGLQSNAASIQKSRAERDVNAFRNLTDTVKHLETLGILLPDLDALNIIHVAGTKGKGSTCAFVECILRKHGYKTGFYSSPHLVSVNERIRINGSPLDKNLFTKYFWEVYNPLQQNLQNGEKMPPYFMFLTIMAFYVFIKEQIDAAVIEVGIGGLYDCTNIVKNPVVVAVTSLGIDHVHLLGQTLAEIASHKAGIFKPGVPAFTVCQHESAMKVLYDKAKEVNCLLMLAPPLQVYNQDFNLCVPSIVQNTNASLALQITATWLKNQSGDSCELKTFKHDVLDNERFFIPMAPTFFIDSKFNEGLNSWVWPGRFQTIERSGITLYLDGAHTQQSMKYCVKWFQDASEQQRKSLKSVVRILLFNCTGERRAENLLYPLSDMNFDLVVFSPNRKSVMKDSSSGCRFLENNSYFVKNSKEHDQSNFSIEPEKEIQQCIINKEIWCHLMRSLNENELSTVTQSFTSLLQHDVKATMPKEDNILQFCCLGNAVEWLINKKNIKHCLSCDRSSTFTNLLESGVHIQVLVTGSLHLVGGVLALLESEA